MQVEGPGWPWDELGLSEPSQDPRSIRRAYGQRLKAMEPDDVAAFESLRQAYDYAMSVGDAVPWQAAVQDNSSVAPLPPASFKRSDPDAANLREGDPYTALQVADAQVASPYAAGKLLERIDGLLLAQVYQPEDWGPVLTALSMVDRATALLVERMLVGRIDFAPGQAPPSAWIHMLDVHFGWLQDGVRFERLHGKVPLAVSRILEARPKVQDREKTHFGWWLLLCGFSLSSMFVLHVRTETCSEMEYRLAGAAWVGGVVTVALLFLWPVFLRRLLARLAAGFSIVAIAMSEGRYWSAKRTMGLPRRWVWPVAVFALVAVPSFFYQTHTPCRWLDHLPSEHRLLDGAQ